MSNRPWLDVLAARVDWGNRIDVAVFSKPDHETGLRSVAEPVQMRVVDHGEQVMTPTFSLRPDEAQQLMDELWRCGLRPTEGSGSAGSLAATERHLKDMQAIAMGLLRKEGMPPCPT
jgi:hypothetical protein